MVRGMAKAKAKAKASPMRRKVTAELKELGQKYKNRIHPDANFVVEKSAAGAFVVMTGPGLINALNDGKQLAWCRATTTKDGSKKTKSKKKA